MLRSSPRSQDALNNPFADLGSQLTDEQLHDIPSYERNKEYSYGAVVWEGYSSEPHVIVYRCHEAKCERGPSGHGWVAAGWYQESGSTPRTDPHHGACRNRFVAQRRRFRPDGPRGTTWT